MFVVAALFSLIAFKRFTRVGPQNFTLVDLAIIDGEGLECEPVNDEKYSGSVVLIERGECNFVDKVSAC